MKEQKTRAAAPTEAEIARNLQDRMVFWTVTASVVAIVCNAGVLAIAVVTLIILL